MTDPVQVAPSASRGDGGAPSRLDAKALLGVIAGGIGLLLVLFVHAALVGVLFAIVAVILGHLGLREIRASGERSRPLALTALGLGYGGIAVAVLLTVVVLSLASTAPDGGGDVPPACTSSTGHFTKQQLRKCVEEAGD